MIKKAPGVNAPSKVRDNLRSRNPAMVFAVTFVVLFCLLYYFNELYIGITSPGGNYSPWLDKHLNYIRGFRHLLLDISSFVLSALGFEAVTDDTHLWVRGHSGIVLVYSCLGFGVMSFFTAFVLAWPKSWKEKAWFLPAGLVLIQALNILRFIVISIFYNRASMNGLIDHHDLFNIILYFILLSVIYWWVNRKVKGGGLKV
ncbi:MAG: glycosyltransferase [Sphingobacteriaceae bacterium]|jgi:exosortase/archaeosortase family protein|nr:glycosyltransferase [Sphingobacteriaceae bacterium]